MGQIESENKLHKNIENLRQRLHQAIEYESMDLCKILRLSTKLDKLIIQYLKRKI